MNFLTYHFLYSLLFGPTGIIYPSVSFSYSIFLFFIPALLPSTFFVLLSKILYNIYIRGLTVQLYNMLFSSIAWKSVLRQEKDFAFLPVFYNYNIAFMVGVIFSVRNLACHLGSLTFSLKNFLLYFLLRQFC